MSLKLAEGSVNAFYGGVALNLKWLYFFCKACETAAKSIKLAQGKVSPWMENGNLALKIADTLECARSAGLRHTPDTVPGIRRERAGEGFVYFHPNGKLIEDAEELERIRTLVIPAAWEDVWICPNSNGHLQATGRDAKGRKQYLYHTRWRKISGEIKFQRMVAFGRALGTIRRSLERDLALPGLVRQKVLATVVKLLETTLIRVGNEEYVKENRSFGLTTLRNRHLEVSGSVLRFRFRGKSGIEHSVEVRDRRVARIVKRCRDLPGHELFEYVDDDGEVRSVASEDVNEYLRDITGDDFTAKDFRTWGGTVCAARALVELGPFELQTQAKKNVVQAIKQVSQHLGNKPATCRKYYVHPAVIEAYLDGSLTIDPDKNERVEEEATLGLTPEERAVLDVIESYDKRAEAASR